MSYTVLARKYRPQTFADMVGQDHVARTLSNAIEGDRVSHAFLFTGARGVGKTTTARILAKALNCERGPTPAPCNECDPCHEITAGTDLDVMEIDGASNNSVDDVRRLQETLPYRPARDRFKVVIVDEVHMLSQGAFNAFLKTLEEPPPHVKFIFATTEMHKVPVTIRSRCQRHDFRLIPQHVVGDRVRQILQAEGIEADDAGVSLVAREAAGSMRDALTLLDQVLAFGSGRLEGEEVARGLGIADRQNVLEMAGALLAGEPARCLEITARLGEQGLDVLHFARQLLSLVRDLVVLKVAGDEQSLSSMVDEEREAAAALVESRSSQELERAFFGLSKLVDEVGQSAHPQMLLEMGLVRLADRPALQPLADLLARLEALEGRLAAGAPAGRAQSGGAGPGGPGGGGGRRGRPGGGVERPGRGAAPARSRPPARASNPPPPTGPAPEPEPPAPAPPLGEPAPARRPASTADDGLPPDWRAIVARLHESQPALGAVLEHAVPIEVGAERLKIGFPEGSFFGKQASASVAREALATAAEQVLGQRPAVEVAIGAEAPGTTVAAQNAAARDARREQIRRDALNDPRVRDAMDVFPEAQGDVDVQVDME